MSITNQPNDGLFNVLIVLTRVVISFGSQPRSDLINACGGDDNLGPMRRLQLNNTLNRWTELGLFENKEDVISVAEPYRAELGSNSDKAERRLPKIARKIVLSAENNDLFWEAERNKSADFTRGLAWMLAQDVYKLDPNEKKLHDLKLTQLPVEKVDLFFRNSARTDGLKAWMVYLGFARWMGQWCIDPTDALRDILSDIFLSNKELSAPLFVQRAGELLPVLDGGQYRTKVEAQIAANALAPRQEGVLSSSMSRAIQRLVFEGDVKLDQRSDSEGVVSLVGAGGHLWRQFSHIRINDA